jgi:hypothetical protein
VTFNHPFGIGHSTVWPLTYRSGRAYIWSNARDLMHRRYHTDENSLVQHAAFLIALRAHLSRRKRDAFSPPLLPALGRPCYSFSPYPAGRVHVRYRLGEEVDRITKSAEVESLKLLTVQKDIPSILFTRNQTVNLDAAIRALSTSQWASLELFEIIDGSSLRPQVPLSPLPLLKVDWTGPDEPLRSILRGCIDDPATTPILGDWLEENEWNAPAVELAHAGFLWEALLILTEVTP